MPISFKRTCTGLLAAMLCTAALPALSSETEAATDPARESRLQVIFDPQSRQVLRQMVHVFGPEPAMRLEFYWEPAAGNWPGVTDQGYADGPGKLGWRVPGTASYDPRAAHHWYEGTLSEGRFHGSGKLSYRDGRWVQGIWAQGALNGHGIRMDADGTRYEGAFVAGLPQGFGSLQYRDGRVYTGPFLAGQPHGRGDMRLPGGAQFAVIHRDGVEVGSARPDILPDDTLKGVLKAQSGGDAGKTTMSVIVDQRITAEQFIGYSHANVDGEIMIFPTDTRLQEVWNGAGKAHVPYELAEIGDSEWDDARAFAVIDMATSDQSRVNLQSLDLAVESSVPHLRPSLQTNSHAGCVGFRPTFDVTNFGWGEVENARGRVRFVNPKSYDYDNPTVDRPGTDWFEFPVGSFDDGIDVSLRDVLVRAGVDVADLESRRFICPSNDQLTACREDAIRSVDFGALTGFVDGYVGIASDLLGELTYEWTDAAGARETVTDQFEIQMIFGAIETPNELAECGAGGAYSTQAPEFIDVELPSSGQNYRIGLPQRGNPNIAALTQGVTLWSRQSAMHLMRAEATFADGSIRTSAPIRLFFVRPRIPDFFSATTPSACFLGPDMFGTC